MSKILANDGIHNTGKKMLEEAGFVVDTQKVNQEDLPSRLDEYDAIIVRSATTVRSELIDACPSPMAIASGGGGMADIDVDSARNKGLTVINTPAARPLTVAELAFSHRISLSRV